MGSRSFFHYSDLTTLVSRGKYVGLDPLLTVKSHGRDDEGWEVTMDQCVEANDKAVHAETVELFTAVPNMCGAFDPENRGAMFRLPLRRAHEVEKDGLGPEISVVKAEKLLQDWANSLVDNRLLLFLSSVCDIKLWRWEDKAKEPSRVAHVSKRYIKGKPSARLPEALPADALQSFEGLKVHLDSLSSEERITLSKIHSATVAIDICMSAGELRETTSTIWLVAQRFDAKSASLRSLIETCGAVPVVGVAFQLTQPAGDEEDAADAAEAKTEEELLAAKQRRAPLNRLTAEPEPESVWKVIVSQVVPGSSGVNVRKSPDMDDRGPEGDSSGDDGSYHVALEETDEWVKIGESAWLPKKFLVASTERAEAEFSGSVFCFLPVGDMHTDLPVHVNASFQLTPNRRQLWLKDPGRDSRLDGKHAIYEDWNEILMTKSLPQLWRMVLVGQAKGDPTANTSARQMKFYPDLNRCNDNWMSCAEAVYVKIEEAEVIPHGRTLGGQPGWVAPSAAYALDLKTPALEQQSKLMHQLYCELRTFGADACVVDVPKHVQDAMVTHSGLQLVDTEDFLEELFQQHRDADIDRIYRLSPIILALAETIRSRSSMTKWKQLLGNDDVVWVGQNAPVNAHILGQPMRSCPTCRTSTIRSSQSWQIGRQT